MNSTWFIFCAACLIVLIALATAGCSIPTLRSNDSLVQQCLDLGGEPILDETPRTRRFECRR